MYSNIVPTVHTCVICRRFSFKMFANKSSLVGKNASLAGVLLRCQGQRFVCLDTWRRPSSSPNLGMWQIYARYLNITSVFKRISQRITIANLQRSSRYPTISADEILYFFNKQCRHRLPGKKSTKMTVCKYKYINRNRINPLIFYFSSSLSDC